ncbi:group I truncated hemoglobin [Candidatus Colwellia aromaticivorans]|uniref:group I truncated hemoglobin n=1 Tax=Candidatus Colwellia aromaticivorans TaxID=2267621 RepID=UPI000DF40804|nr:group 1 truncated hemoglobin [Candidatus Colwellia aromaticivorans]
MIKHIFYIALVSSITACSTNEKSVLTVEEQAANVTTMCSENANAIQQRQKSHSLYSRLGERPGIKEFATNLYASHKANPVIGHFFEHVPKDPFIKNVTDFVSVHSGGGGVYTQRDMTTVHKDLGISLENFLAAGGDVQAVLADLGRGENEIQEVICFLVSLAPTVVTK